MLIQLIFLQLFIIVLSSSLDNDDCDKSSSLVIQMRKGNWNCAKDIVITNSDKALDHKSFFEVEERIIMKEIAMLKQLIDTYQPANYINPACTNNTNINNTNKFTTVYNSRHDVINSVISERGTINSYLEIGVEYGITIKYVNALHKIGVDPDPKFENTGEFSNIQLIKETSDSYFAQLDVLGNDRFDIIFIDGMHQIEYMIKDICNSLRYIKRNGIIFIDDILPLNEREQRKIPEKHYYENGILKYGEPWTGDVWKVFYYLLLNFKENFDFQVYNNSWYRGVCKLYNIKPFDLVIDDAVLEVVNNYSYESDFNDYRKLLVV